MNILALCVYVCKDVHLNSSVICFYISASLQVVKTWLWKCRNSLAFWFWQRWAETWWSHWGSQTPESPASRCGSAEALKAQEKRLSSKARILRWQNEWNSSLRAEAPLKPSETSWRFCFLIQTSQIQFPAVVIFLNTQQFKVGMSLFR